MTAPYVFRGRAGESRHGRLVGHLAAMLDPISLDVLEPYILHGARFLEIGAGASTVPQRMAERGMIVTATDLDPRGIPGHPGMTIATHNIATDPLGGRWDVIHARIVLVHVPERIEVIGRLVNALTADGVLIIEEYATHWTPTVIRSPDPEAPRLLASYQQALMRTMVDAGSDTDWGRELSGVMAGAGLRDVQAEYRARQWRGGEPGCLLPHTMIEHRRDDLIDAGMTPEDLDRLHQLLLDPQLVIASGAVVSVTGHRP